VHLTTAACCLLRSWQEGYSGDGGILLAKAGLSQGTAGSISDVFVINTTAQLTFSCLPQRRVLTAASSRR